ncbi:hypothetical protein POM88_012191 [Heracleum sosnowskyi]|uniref:DUF4283 domain-containing protein n=1 Tax=Heracleum sosnowskyi TaxID=360622 RepID=A0AAD8MX65_9APIA|nr:hypothetical protein POM88_012191 [Heracleum sosnowskyi]
MADLNIDEEENGEFMFDDDVEEHVNKYELCLVGRFLTEKNINTRAMFYHREDMLWVCNGGHWSFDNAMLITSQIPSGEDPLKVPLWFIEIWIQIHDLPTVFMSESV